MANATYTYFVYTRAKDANNQMQVLDEVRTFLRTRLETSFEDLVDNVQLTVMLDEIVPEGCPTNTPATVPPGYTTTCTQYSTYIEASMGRQWDVDIFSRTVVQTIQYYIDAYNAQETKAAFVIYNGPTQVQTNLTLLLVGARRLMNISEYSFLADVLQYSALPQLAMANDPPLNITNVEYIWQRVVERGAPSPPSQQGGGGVRRRNQVTNLPPLSVQVEMIVVATCAGLEGCTNEALSQFVLTTFPQVSDVFLENVRKWSQTEYFNPSRGITAIVLDTEDPNPTFIDTPELPPDSDYRTPGVQEEDKPLWIWFALLIALGALIISCVYVTFCITARDFQAARKMRGERRQAQQEEKEGRQRLQTEGNNQRDAVPPSPPRQSRLFASAPASPPPEQPEEVEFDVIESNRVDDANITEAPRTPGKKKKKKKKKTSAEGDAASPDKAASSPQSKSPNKQRSDSPKKSRSKSPNKKKKSKEGETE